MTVTTWPGNPLRVHAEPAERAAIIQGLEDLTADLKANPDIEVRRWGIEIQFAPKDGTEGVARHAALFGVPVDDRGHALRAVKRYGPLVAYVAYAAKTGAES